MYRVRVVFGHSIVFYFFVYKGATSLMEREEESMLDREFKQ